MFLCKLAGILLGSFWCTFEGNAGSSEELTVCASGGDCYLASHFFFNLWI